MNEATGAEPQMWGSGIVGFGTYHYKYASGREGDWPLYLMRYGFDQDTELLNTLGKHSLGKGCLYIKRVSDIHLPTLKKLIKASVKKQKTRG